MKVYILVYYPNASPHATIEQVFRTEKDAVEYAMSELDQEWDIEEWEVRKYERTRS